MTTASEIALSYQMALTNQLNMTANNIANTSTPGFQSSHPLFAEYLVNTENGQKVAYVEDVGMVRNINPGPLNLTGGPLDVGIQGEGYFTVEKDGVPYYTRNGSFRLDADGRVMTSSGATVLDDSGTPIVIADGARDIQITRDGVISTSNGKNSRLGIVTFENQQDMKLIGSSLLSTNQTPVEAGNAEIVQGMIEGSNVTSITEITRMVEILRSYQSAAQMIITEDERVSEAIQTLTQIV